MLGDPRHVRAGGPRPCAGGPPAPRPDQAPSMPARAPFSAGTTTTRLGKGFRLDRDKVIARARTEMEEFDVRPPDPFLKSAKFSGGNQQKIIIAREIKSDPDLLIVGQPTRGVDIGAIEFIHKRIIAAARRGQGRAAGLGGTRRDPLAVRPHPGDVRRPHHGRARPRGRRARARPAHGRRRRRTPPDGRRAGRTSGLGRCGADPAAQPHRGAAGGGPRRRHHRRKSRSRPCGSC